MGKSLGGTVFIRNATEFDYCIRETILCLQDFCDKVVVLDAGSTDNTKDLILDVINGKTKVIELTNDDWFSQTGKQKLAYFTNVAIEHLDTDYHFCLQADEILHEKSYEIVRDAIESGSEGVMCSRINLWGSPYMKLSVPQERKPCSTQVIRLAKTKYRSMDDSENLGAFPSFGFYQDIRIYHMGFVRKREVMKAKITHIQKDVFQTEPDTKLNGMDIFNPYAWFDKEKDLTPIDEPLPKIIQQWAKERVYKD